MKKNKLKALVKSTRKATKENLRVGIATQLKETVGKSGISSKKVNKEIEKSAKQLAKRLSSEIKIDKDALALTVAEPSELEIAGPVKVVKVSAKKAAEPKAEIAAS